MILSSDITHPTLPNAENVGGAPDITGPGLQGLCATPLKNRIRSVRAKHFEQALEIRGGGPGGAARRGPKHAIHGQALGLWGDIWGGKRRRMAQYFPVIAR
jgi:hypothetical protein